MDATSTSGNGFDAALKALEDLETGVDSPGLDVAAGAAAPAGISPPAMTIGLADIDDEPASITASPFTEAEPRNHETQIHEPAPMPAQAAAEPAPTVVHPASAPVVAPAGAGKTGKILIGLALFSSMVSAAGLIVAERTIMSAQLVVADARERAHQLEQANKLIRDLELVRDRQIELLRQQQIQAASAPVTSAELQHRIETLQAGLVERDPLNRVAEILQERNIAENARFNELGQKLARVEAALGH